MKTRYKIFLALLGVWFVAIVATLPELAAVWPERKVVQGTFANYADALVNQKFSEAYGYHSPEFQDKVSLESFVQYQHEVQAKFGLLESVKRRGMTVRKWRSPSRERAIVIADFQYAKATVRYTFELHRENDHWTIFSSSGKER